MTLLHPWLSRSAKAQAVKEDVWWQTNRREAPNAFWDELMASIDHLRRFPESGLAVRGAREGMRRVLLETSLYHVYYLPHADTGQLRIYAVWSAERHDRPALPKPLKKRSPRRKR